ncbi:unnamed protein product [Protopolystoma xenopodis]|uniref:Uncharacterized protein n=1 Tax=Protopolystoma xenopodis TaxID=117903 RepID=A0A448WH05_9PLAT|nr:unnamed protein product [Protopolystoma xenopodis]
MVTYLSVPPASSFTFWHKRAFRDILGYLVCPNVETQTALQRAINPVLRRLLRFAGGLSGLWALNHSGHCLPGHCPRLQASVALQDYPLMKRTVSSSCTHPSQLTAVELGRFKSRHTDDASLAARVSPATTTIPREENGTDKSKGGQEDEDENRVNERREEEERYKEEREEEEEDWEEAKKMVLVEEEENNAAGNEGEKEINEKRTEKEKSVVLVRSRETVVVSGRELDDLRSQIHVTMATGVGRSGNVIVNAIQKKTVANVSPIKGVTLHKDRRKISGAANDCYENKGHECDEEYIGMVNENRLLIIGEELKEKEKCKCVKYKNVSRNVTDDAGLILGSDRTVHRPRAYQIDSDNPLLPELRQLQQPENVSLELPPRPRPPPPADIKMRADLALAVLVELARGQTGALAVGREAGATAHSLPVSGPQHLARFLLSSPKFHPTHLIGRLTLLDKLIILSREDWWPRKPQTPPHHHYPHEASSDQDRLRHLQSQPPTQGQNKLTSEWDWQTGSESTTEITPETTFDGSRVAAVLDQNGWLGTNEAAGRLR